MSKIQIECDRCGKSHALPVRQNHIARETLAKSGWTSQDKSSRFGGLKEDYCPECS